MSTLPQHGPLVVHMFILVIQGLSMTEVISHIFHSHLGQLYLCQHSQQTLIRCVYSSLESMLSRSSEVDVMNTQFGLVENCRRPSEYGFIFMKLFSVQIEDDRHHTHI